MGELHVVRQKEADVKMPDEMPLVVADGMKSAHWIVHGTAHEFVVSFQGLLTQVEQAKAFWYTHLYRKTHLRMVVCAIVAVCSEGDHLLATASQCNPARTKTHPGMARPVGVL